MPKPPAPLFGNTLVALSPFAVSKHGVDLFLWLLSRCWYGIVNYFKFHCEWSKKIVVADISNVVLKLRFVI